MLQEFREKIQGGLAKVIIVLICIPFAFFGIESFLRGPTDKPVAEVDNIQITESDLREMIFLKKRQLMVEMGDNIDYTQLEDEKLRSPALDDLVNNQLFVNEASHNHLLISDLQAQREIISTPAFMENNQFSNDKFKLVIQQAGLTEDLYMRLVKKELLINQLVSSLTFSEFLSKPELDEYESMINEVRDVSLIKLTLEGVKDQVKITDEELKTYYEANSHQFKSQEKVALEYIKLSIDDYLSPISRQKVQQAYNNEIKSFVPENIYALSHIQINEDQFSNESELQDQLNLIQTELKSEQLSFEELVKKYSDDLGSKNLGGKLGRGKATLFPEDFIKAVSQIKVGQYSAPIKAGESYHIIKLDEFVKDTAPSFEDRKLALEKELALAEAEPAFNGDQEKLKDLVFNFSNLDEAAKQLKKKTIFTSALTKQEVSQLFEDPLIIQAIFSDEVLIDGQNTDVFEVKDNVFISARVKIHEDATVKPFTVVKAEIKSILFKQKAEFLLTNKINELKLTLKSSEKTLKAIANEAGAQYKFEKAVSRNSLNKLDRVTLTKAFELPPVKSSEQASFDTVSFLNGDKGIVLVNNVADSLDAEMPAGFLKNIEQMLIRNKGGQLINNLQTNLKSKANIKIQ